MGHSSFDGGHVQLQVNELKRLSDANSKSTTIFEPQSNTNENSNEKGESSGTASSSTVRPADRAPEKRLTLFALRLAVLEKVATGLGTLGFIWATVVLLGGFAITLDASDFWFITVILLIESGRVFGRSHELEWQHQATTWSLADAGINSFRLLKSSSNTIWVGLKSLFSLKRSKDRQIKPGTQREERSKKLDKQHLESRWASSEVTLLPYVPWVSMSRKISKILQWLQVAAAITCVVLSSMKIIRRNFARVDKDDSDKRNRESALLIFYGLALSEASLFLLERLYWETEVIYCKILEQVNTECEFGPSGIVSIRRFFYDAYSRCVEGSVFDGLKMDMVSFAIELLSSTSPEEQLMGARILRCFAMSERFSDDTLQKLGTSFLAVERLVEMLNWKYPEQHEIRCAAAIILSKLAGMKHNSLRVAGIPGSMESISSLLCISRNSSPAIADIGDTSVVADHELYEFWTFNQLGLSILEKLARDHDNCGKIGNTRGLLANIVDLTSAGEKLLNDENVPESQILTVKRSLQVIRMLLSTTGNTGKQLRRDISEIVFTISNIRDILRHGEKHPDLQKLGIEILTSLAMEDDAAERIGGTGGVILVLLNIFLMNGTSDRQVPVRKAAGESLSMLALACKQNCYRILKMGALDRLVAALEVPLLRVNAARIVRNLCTYCAEEYFLDLRRVTAAVPTVLKGIISQENELQEVMVGLAARAFNLMSYEESTIMFQTAEIDDSELAVALVQILQKYQYPIARSPRIRRYTIELSIWMMKNRDKNTNIFKHLQLDIELKNVRNTTSELESFNIFSGAVGLSRCRTSMHTLVEIALNLLGYK